LILQSFLFNIPDSKSIKFNYFLCDTSTYIERLVLFW